ncbi:MAG: hypothetical protein ACM3VW_10010, partial [Bacteroidota bacterium]
MRSQPPRLLLLLLFLCLAVMTEHWQSRASYLLKGTDYTPIMMKQHLDTWTVWLTRPAPPPPGANLFAFVPVCAPNVYRVLRPAIYAGINSLPHAKVAQMLFAVLLTFVLYLALYKFGRVWFGPPVALGFVLLGVLMSVNPWNFDLTSGLMQGVLILACLFAFLHRSPLLYPAFVLLMANREDGVIIIAVLAVLAVLDRTRRRELAPVLLGLTAIAFAYQVGAHLWLGPRPRYCPWLMIDENLRQLSLLLRTGNLHLAVALFFTTFAPLLTAALMDFRHKPPLVRSMVLVTVAYLAFTFVFGVILESHRNWQLIILLLPAAMWTLGGGASGAAVAAPTDAPDPPEEQPAGP